MRNRHLPRLCRKCQAPMARQESSCWSCGAEWAEAEATPNLRVIRGEGRSEEAAASAGTELPRTAVAGG